jgi:hypothetical protein
MPTATVVSTKTYTNRSFKKLYTIDGISTNTSTPETILPIEGLVGELWGVKVACNSTDFTFKIVEVASQSAYSVHEVYRRENIDKATGEFGIVAPFECSDPELYFTLTNADTSLETGTIYVQLAGRI